MSHDCRGSRCSRLYYLCQYWYFNISIFSFIGWLIFCYNHRLSCWILISGVFTCCTCFQLIWLLLIILINGNCTINSINSLKSNGKIVCITNRRCQNVVQYFIWHTISSFYLTTFMIVSGIFQSRFLLSVTHDSMNFYNYSRNIEYIFEIRITQQGWVQVAC